MPPHPPPHPDDKKITVYLTGFGSFSRIDDNPSWAIVSSFLNPANQTITIPGYRITFRPHPEALKVSYATVNALVPELWAVHGKEWDYILHIGVGLEGGFGLETQAWECGYKLEDVDGCIPIDGGCSDGGGGGCGDDGGDGDGKGREGKKGKQKEKGKGGNGVEMTGVHGSENSAASKGEGRILKTALDVPWVVELTKEDKGEHVQIKVSKDAGLYLCSYIFRSSLLEAEKRGDRARERVAFLHVPPVGKRYGIQTGRDVVLKVVEGMVRDGEGLREV